MSTTTRTKHQNGFTIVELMIATVVFSTVMLVITVGVIQFSRIYYTSINRSRTQNVARTIVSQLSQAVQFTGVVITPSTIDSGTGLDYFCAGGKIYTFRTGTQYTGDTASAGAPGLYVMPRPSGCSPLISAEYDDARGQQLLGKGMCISRLSLTSAAAAGSQMYNISLTLVYADYDLLAGTASATSCAPASSGATVACKSGEGSQYCAVSPLNATVQRRLQDGQLSP